VLVPHLVEDGTEEDLIVVRLGVHLDVAARKISRVVGDEGVGDH